MIGEPVESAPPCPSGVSVMRIVFLTGIWPPDVGGPATHGPELSRFLVDRGHDVVVITMGDGAPTVTPCEVVVISRSSRFPVRYGRVAATSARRARAADVIYATATYAAAGLASAVSRTPLVVKLVSDPAYERARRYGLFHGTLEEFQTPGSAPVEALKSVRTRALRRARALVVPSAYLAKIAVGWGLDQKRMSVLPNPAPDLEVVPSLLEAGTFAFVGRLTRQKDLGLAIAAIGRVPRARLTVIGDGPDRERLEELARVSGASDRIVFRGSLPRSEALAIVAGADAALLTSTWENFPHSVVEALTVGVPVVSTAVGGVPEIVRDGVNGLLVPVGDADAVAEAVARILGEAGLRDALAAASRTSVSHLSVEQIYGSLETVLEGARNA
jgi:glycosyltransferase involved in cell wall biosynthesis